MPQTWVIRLEITGPGAASRKRLTSLQGKYSVAYNEDRLITDMHRVWLIFSIFSNILGLVFSNKSVNFGLFDKMKTQKLWSISFILNKLKLNMSS